MKRKMTCWWIFTWERFDPLSHLIIITLFFLAHYAVYSAGLKEPNGEVNPLGIGKLLWLAVGTAAFFFKLRLYDEIKDYEVDLHLNPTRPLVRGVLTHQDLQKGIVTCIGLELASFGWMGSKALISISAAILYSLLMYREFFIARHIRPYLTTYAISHTVVSVFLSLALFSAMHSRFPFSLSPDAYRFSLNSWCLFNIFEFGRKTFTSAEEHPSVDSYSKLFGRYGAIALVIAMAICSTWLLIQMKLPDSELLIPFLGFVGFILAGTAFAYAFLDRARFGKLYRTMSSFYIVLVYFGVVALYGPIKG